MASSAVMVFKLLFYIFACEECIDCAIIDFSGEAMNLLKSYGFENPTSNELKVAKNFILEKRDEKIRTDEKIYQKEQQITNLTNRNEELSHRNGKLESDKEAAEAFARQAVSPSRIRKTIERLQQTYVINHSFMAARMGTIDSKVDGQVDKIKKEILGSIRFIFFQYDVAMASITRLQALLIHKNQTKNDENGNGNGRRRRNKKVNMTMEEVFNTKWSTLKTALKYHVKDGDVCRPNNFEKEDSLRTVVLKLACIETVVDANNFIESLKEEQIWEKFMGERSLSKEDKKTLTSLTNEEVFRRINDRNIGTRLDSNLEEIYATEYLQVKIFLENQAGTIKEEDSNNQYYKECMNVLYFSVHPDILELRVNLTKINHYKNQPSYMARHYLCFDISALYNLVSNIHKHTAGLHPPPNCEPNDEDVRYFMRDLVPRFKKSQYPFIAETWF